MSDDFMDFLNSQEKGKQEHTKREEEYQARYEKTIRELYKLIRQWMEPYETAGKLSIIESIYGPKDSSSITELTIQFNDTQKIYITPNVGKQLLNTLFAVNITHFNGDIHPHKEAEKTQLLYDDKLGWFIDLEFPNRKEFNDQTFKDIIKSKLL